MSQPILESRKLLAFATLARLGSFTQAAKELSLTQSAVSHAIKALERDLGCRLFDRMGRAVTITPAGSQLLQHTGVILAEMQHARADLAVFSR
jgi:DNA-binding transcriptional LysR family regulator